jgi:arylsulfatase A-like enzyme
MQKIDRRSFLGVSALAPALVSGQSRRKKPNVLFIAIDDLNNWIGCLNGHPGTKTPNLDRLASEGVLFTQAHCAAPVCNPSRAALMTGKRPSTSGVYENQQPMRKSTTLKDIVTLPQYLQQNGYTVIGGGKIYHTAYPDPASWQEYFPSQQQNKPPDPLPPKRPMNGIPRAGNFDWGPLDATDRDMGDSKVVDWASAQLRKSHNKPFFLACGIFRPHLPWHVPQKYFDMHPLNSIVLPNVNPNDLDDVPPIGRHLALRSGDHKKVLEHNQWKNAVQAYLAAISFADAQVGRVLEALRRSAYAKNTAVVLWSDHGWHLGQKLHWRKFALWEEATHNVFMIKAPGITRPGGRCNRTVSLMDTYPTLLDICGLPAKPSLEGVSLLPLLKNPTAAWDRPAVSTYLRGNHSVRSERWRYIRYNDGTEELYDHSKDPLEWTNLAGKHEFNAVKKEHARWLPTSDAPDSPVERGVDELD